jgi:hypothetical protein
MKRLLKRAIIPLFILLAAACLGFVFILRQTPAGPKPVTDLDEYPKVLESFADNPSLSHFPLEIPADASEAYLYYHPGFLQGGTVFQLRLRIPNEQILMEKEQWLPQAIDPSEYESIPLRDLRAGYEPGIQMPETFELIWLGVESAGQGEYEWNHGATYGIAINEVNSEIVYWFEWW